MANISHKNIVRIDKYWIVPNYLIFVEMDVPEPIQNWKTFCKQNFSTSEMLQVAMQITEALDHLHS